MIPHTSDLQHSMYSICISFLVPNFGQQGASNDNGGLILTLGAKTLQRGTVFTIQLGILNKLACELKTCFITCHNNRSHWLSINKLH